MRIDRNNASTRPVAEERIREVIAASAALLRALGEPEHPHSLAVVRGILRAEQARFVYSAERAEQPGVHVSQVPRQVDRSPAEYLLEVPVLTRGGRWGRFAAVRRREPFRDVDVAIALMLESMSCGAFHPPAEPAGSALLSPRERAVAECLALGSTRAAIARELGVSVRTVDKHLEHIYRKLGRHDRLTAARAIEAAALP